MIHRYEVARICAVFGTLGLALGFMASESTPVAATATTKIHIYAGVDYGTAQLNCGWHDACGSNPVFERGLDFQSSTPAIRGRA